MCLILKISMNVTLVATTVQQHKCVSISREAINAWILYSVTCLTSKLVTSEYFCSYFPIKKRLQPLFAFECIVICVPLHLCSSITLPYLKMSLFNTWTTSVSPSSTVSACVQLKTLPAGTSPSLFCTDTWTCPRAAVCLQTSSRCRPPRATPAPSTSSR